MLEQTFIKYRPVDTFIFVNDWFAVHLNRTNFFKAIPSLRTEEWLKSIKVMFRGTALRRFFIMGI